MSNASLAFLRPIVGTTGARGWRASTASTISTHGYQVAMPTIGDVFNPNSKAITSRQRHIVLVTLGSLLVLSCLFFSIGIFHSDPPQTYPPGWEYSMTVLHIGKSLAERAWCAVRD